MLKVYSYFNSICTQKVFITLAEKGLAYDTQNVDLFKNEQFKPEYLKINPKGVVPALDHDGRVVIESSLICEYLDDTFPKPPSDSSRSVSPRAHAAVEQGCRRNPVRSDAGTKLFCHVPRADA